MGKKAVLSIAIVSDADDRGFRKAIRQTSSLVRSAALVTAKYAALGAAISGAAAVAGGAVGSLGLGLLGVGALAGPALGAVLLGMDGIKAAAAGASAGFTQLRQSASSALQQTMGPGFAALGTMMSDLAADVGNLAAATGVAFSRIAGTIAAHTMDWATLTEAAAAFVAATVPGIQQLIDGIAALGPAIAPVADALGAAFGTLAGSIGGALTQLAQTGTLTAVFAGFGDVVNGVAAVIGPLLVMLGQLGAVVGPILGQLFATLGPALTALTGPLVQMASTVGGALLVAVQAIAPVLGPVASAFASILAAVAPLIPPIAQLAAVLAGGLAQVIAAIAPAFTQLATALASALMPVLPVIAQLFTQLAPVLGQVAGILGAALSQAIAQLAPVLPPLAGAFLQIVQAVLPLLPPLAQLVAALLPVLVQVITAAVPMVVRLADLFTQVAGIIVSLLAPWLRILTEHITRIGPAIAPLLGIAQGVFGGIASFIGACIDKVAALIGWIGRIRFPSPPGWMSRMFAGTAELYAVPPETLAPRLGSLHMAAGYPSVAGLGALAAAGGAVESAPVYNITVNGALDPQAVADQIRSVIEDTDRARGSVTAARLTRSVGVRV